MKLPSSLLLCAVCVGLVLTDMNLCLAATDAVPRLNIAPTCESEGRKAMALGRSSIEACKKSELEAHRALAKKWPHYQKVDRTTCLGRISHGGHPSYVELQSCLESFKHARDIREADAKGRNGTSTAHPKEKF